jgi:excisionase family DNA binding protein
MELITIEEASKRLTLSPRSLVDKRFRARLGLPGIKVGRKMCFNVEDIDAFIRRNREQLPAFPAQETPHDERA